MLSTTDLMADRTARKMITDGVEDVKNWIRVGLTPKAAWDRYAAGTCAGRSVRAEIRRRMAI